MPFRNCYTFSLRFRDYINRKQVHHEIRNSSQITSPSCNHAVGNSKLPLRKKSSTTIHASEGGNYNSADLDVDVERGLSYTISWSAHKDAGEGANYGINIRSYDGHENP